MKSTFWAAIVIQIVITIGIFYVFHEYSRIQQDNKSKAVERPGPEERKGNSLRLKQTAVIRRPVSKKAPAQPKISLSESISENQLQSYSCRQALRRFQLIENTTYSVQNPFQQSRGPPLVIYEAIPRSFEPQVKTTIEEIDTIVNNLHTAFTQEIRCRICHEHQEIAYYLWTNYFKPRFYADNALTASALSYKGFYLEMGALDGLSGSNTLFLDQSLQWNGLMIEANPPNFVKLLTNRPYSHRVEMAACPCTSTSTITPCQLEFIGDYGGTGGLTSTMDEKVRKTFHGQRGDTYNVSCLPLSTIFDQQQISKIDFFSLDVEGAEYSTLLTIDFSRISIWLLLVEQNPDVASTAQVRELLRSVGFIFRAKVGEMNELWENPQYVLNGMA